MKWILNSRGRIEIESKDDARQRGMPSSDRAGALIMSYVEGAQIMTEYDVPQPPTKSITGGLLDMKC